MVLIEISSSSDRDSDLEVEHSREHDRATTNTRTLPPWGSTSNGHSRLGKGTFSNGSSSEHAPKENGVKASRQYLGADRSNYFLDSGSSGPRINSRISNGSTGDHERLSSQQALNRTLPSFMQPSTSGKPIHVEENKFRHCENDSHGNYYHSSWSTSSNNKGIMRDDSYKAHDNELVMLGSRGGGRVLPSSMMSVKSMPTQHFASSSDTSYRPAIVDERLNISDERLIYQAALEDLNQPKVEASLPDGLLSVPLLRHQKIALAWMLQKETRSLHCLGGILADDQGLGKTVSMIALIQMQKSLESKSKLENSPNRKTEALNLDDDEDDTNKVQESAEVEDTKPVPEVSTSHAFSKRRPAAGTLVVCPASVLRQWARELDEKVADEAKLSVLVYHGGNRTKDAAELAKYDVVLTTYAIVTLEVPKQPQVDGDDADEKNEEKYGVSSDFSANKKRKKTFNASNKKGKKKGKKGIDSFDCDSGTLAKVGWLRVILDEAQTIKNHRTQMARACCSLRAKRRWCLSGTPIQNSIDDLYSYFRFLKYEPYAVYKSFYHTIKTPISRNALNGYKKLQAVLRAVMLRRTKGTLIDGEPIIRLPPKSITLAKVDFSSEERDFYTQLEAASRSQFKAYAAAGTVRQNYASILLMLLRLRQACDHPLLVKGYNNHSAKVSGEMAKKLPRDTLKKLLYLLESSAVCQACNDTPEEPVVTMCQHVFCYQCVSEYLSGDDNMCPEHKCKEHLSPDAVYTKFTLRNCISSSSDDDDGAGDDASTSSVPHNGGKSSSIMRSDYSSTKIKAVLEILQMQCLAANKTGAPVKLDDEEDEDTFQVNEGCQFDANVVKHTTVYSNSSPTEGGGPSKAIIFSQWTGMLNLVEHSLNQFCVEYRRLDGTMSLAARDKAVKDFNTDPEITVMLMSLKAGNLGLNMVAACHVILLDLWWNPSTEDQAVDRAHRIGQTRPVTVTRITIKDTVEDRILSLQEEKRKMVASAFGEDQGGSSATRLTVDDLKYLFMI